MDCQTSKVRSFDLDVPDGSFTLDDLDDTPLTQDDIRRYSRLSWELSKKKADRPS
jgi:hypothetical protein